jgi:SAM-dependent methyltransferase
MQKILIFGSCVSRDAFNLEEARQHFKVVDYYARSSLAALATPPVTQNLALETIESPFQRRMVERDLSRAFFSDIASAEFDVLLLDLIDERFDIAELTPGTFVTLSGEFLKVANIDREAVARATIRSGTPRHRYLWLRGVEHLVGRLREAGRLARLVINPVAWADSFEDGSPIPGIDSARTERANQHLAWMHEKLYELAPEARVLRFDESVFRADPNHQWGVAQFHYGRAYYKTVLAQLQPPQTLRAPDVRTESQTVSREIPAASPPTRGAQSFTPNATHGALPEALRVLAPRPNSGTVGATMLSDKPVDLALAVQGLDRVSFYIELQCGAGIQPRQVLLQVDFDDWSGLDPSSSGLSRPDSSEVGWCLSLETAPGLRRYQNALKVPPHARRMRLRLRTWNASDTVYLTALSAPDGEAPPLSAVLISVDVEALPGRAPGDLVDRLMLGRTGGGEYGVKRLCDIFADYGVRATFFVDYASCERHGDKPVYAVAELLRDRGHDVQLHIHPEHLVRDKTQDIGRGDHGWVSDPLVIPSLSKLSFGTARSVIDYCMRKYKDNLGEAPEILRPGALQIAAPAVLAAQTCGLRAMSTAYASYYPKLPRGFDTNGVLRWESGLLEFPVDLGIDPLNERTTAPLRLQSPLVFKRRPMLSLILHSWSLLYRDEQSGHHVRYEESYEQNLRRVLATLRDEGGDFMTHRDAVRHLEGLQNLPRLTFSNLPLSADLALQTGRAESDRECNICGTLLRPSAMKLDVCDSCRGRTRHRVLKRVLDEQIGNVFEGRTVIANHAAPHEIRDLLADAASLTNFDVRPLPHLDCVADVQDLSRFDAGAFDVFYSVYVLNHVRDDGLALREMRRVLKDDGFAVVMVPFRTDQPTEPMKDQTAAYGADALQRFGVGSYRYYGLDDFLDLAGAEFDTAVHFATDPVTGSRDAVFICRPRKFAAPQ